MKSPGELKILIVLSKSKFLKYCRRFQGFKLLSLGVLGKLMYLLVFSLWFDLCMCKGTKHAFPTHSLIFWVFKLAVISENS